MSTRLTILELAQEVGLQERSLRKYVGLGLPVVETGKRGKMYFDLAKCRAWLEAHRRTVVGEGRPRVEGDGEAREKRHELDAGQKPHVKTAEKTPGGPKRPTGGTQKETQKEAQKENKKENKKEIQKEEPEDGETGDGLPDIGDKTPAELLTMVAEGQLNPGHVSLYKQVLEVMELTVDFRRRMKELAMAADIAAELKPKLVQARGILDRLPESIVAIVGSVVPLDDGQRHKVREGARKEVESVIDQLGGREKKALGTGH